MLNLVCRLHRKSKRIDISNGQQTKLIVPESLEEEMCLELGAHNGSIYAAGIFVAVSAR